MRDSIVTLILAAVAAGCGPQLPDPVPVAEPGELARRLQTAPDRPQLITFDWRYRGRDGRFSGEGGVRFNPPDSVRLDLLGPGWSGVQTAVMLAEQVYYLGEQRVHLPPPTFMWTALGMFRPPWGIEPRAVRRGERVELTYDLAPRRAVTFAFDGAGRVVEAVLTIDGDAIEEIKLTRDGADAGWSLPSEARYRDLSEFHEVRIEVNEVREHEPFEPRIFSVVPW
ncbi:MAG: hypothetical protein GWN99_04630 [Gemmatimonadetes bacterium]|uniref:Uncharacterized protein n=1 Tax=Candidatus Kutchimonas denitrificans TaxID=3056748 RepID=A0AAE5C9Q6_9BACT|nr:hypothetical protein [Gemmatimonadota bacterium]NIR75736.1 hypothetical protein [Candidatus Kutchimonas denitrificans]NIS00349.1 hypothetical protein [Gemmatimonadota bacterium]NIT66008.1 hypothetical protein [Gemmatimonadota bacterium]NIU53712.1 hypothetical protein [Gemmatimonadota bacterium]